MILFKFYPSANNTALLIFIFHRGENHDLERLIALFMETQWMSAWQSDSGVHHLKHL